MSKATSKNRRLMDLLPGDHRWGELLGVLATTFEFDAHFFETDFLPALLRLGSWDDSGWVSRVALERGLSALEGVWIAVDQRRYRGRPKSLRVEVRPAIGVQGTTLHAKVSVLVYERAVRVQVASANLTEFGYREYREVAISLLATPDAPEHVELAKQVLDGMKDRMQPWWSPTADRVFGLAAERVNAWPRKPSDTRFVWSDGTDVLWKQVVEAWPEGAALESIVVVSPFWSEEGDAGPLRQFVGALRKRGKVPAILPVHLLTEAVADGDGWRPKLPQLGAFEPGSFGIALTARAVLPLPSDEGNANVRKPRALHAKIVVLRGAKRSVAYSGSGNFTARGWGFGSARANIEAGLILTGSTDELERSLLPPVSGPAIELTSSNLPVAGENTESEDAFPTFLLGVWLEPDAKDADRLCLRIEVNQQAVQGAWSIRGLSGGTPLHGGGSGGASSQVLAVANEVLEFLLRDQEVEVVWWGCPLPGRYPVNIELAARARLPVAPGRAEPGESALLAYYQGRIRFEDLYPPPPGWEEDNPETANPVNDLESTVDTSRIQSYQVREFVEALSGLREDLRTVACATEASMRRAVLGSVSPVALAKEIESRVRDGKRSATAAGFELVELGSCLVEARRVENAKPAWPRVVDEGLGALRKTLDRVAELHPELAAETSTFRKYERSILEWNPTGVAP